MVRKVKTMNNQKVNQVVSRKLEYSGIIPPPNIIEGYERNCPGATDRILAMAENQLKHKQEMEALEQKSISECRENMLKSEIESYKRGQLFGFIIMILALIGSFILIMKGHSTGGYCTALGTILFYFGSVMYKKNVHSKEKNDEQN